MACIENHFVLSANRNLSCPFVNARSPILLTPQSQLKEAATEVELYQYVAQSFRAFEQTVHVTASINSATAGDHLCEAASDGRSDTLLRSDHVLLPGEVANAMGTVLASGNFLDFEPLEEAVDR